MNEIYLKRNGTKPLACCSPFVMKINGRWFRWHPGYHDHTEGPQAEPPSIWPENTQYDEKIKCSGADAPILARYTSSGWRCPRPNRMPGNEDSR